MTDTHSSLSAQPVHCSEQVPSLPLRKRKKAQEAEEISVQTKSQKNSVDEDTSASKFKKSEKCTAEDIENANRAIRLEQNRRAARETRRRKKIMVEELQRSVLHFTRANSIVKIQNDEFERMLLDARSQISLMQKTGIGMNSLSMYDDNNRRKVQVRANEDLSEFHDKHQRAKEVEEAIASAKAQAQAMSLSLPSVRHTDATKGIALQAFYESQGFSPAAAKAVSQIDPKRINEQHVPEFFQTVKDSFSLSSTNTQEKIIRSHALSESLKNDLLPPSVPPPNPFLSLLEAVKVNQMSMMSNQLTQSLEQVSSNPFLLSAALLYTAAASGEVANPYSVQNLTNAMQSISRHSNLPLHSLDKDNKNRR